jgi:hypothetical protein
MTPVNFPEANQNLSGSHCVGTTEVNYTHGAWLLMTCPECQGRSAPTIATTKALTGCRCEHTAHPGYVEVVR